MLWFIYLCIYLFDIFIDIIFFFKCWVVFSDIKYKNDYEDLFNFDLM